MAALQWSDALALDLPLMDDTHREFVDLLAAVEAADDAALVAAWQALVEHTAQHFGQEDAWMAATRFASGNLLTPCSTRWCCRSCAMARRAPQARASLHVVRAMAGELALWFPACAKHGCGAGTAPAPRWV